MQTPICPDCGAEMEWPTSVGSGGAVMLFCPPCEAFEAAEREYHDALVRDPYLDEL